MDWRTVKRSEGFGHGISDVSTRISETRSSRSGMGV